MKILVTGAKGQLGTDVVNELKNRNITVMETDIGEMDITDITAVRGSMLSFRPDAIIHCAAYTLVDAAEENRELCSRINITGTENIAAVCHEIDAAMMYISTDYVFDGEGAEPWKPENACRPVNYYGETKRSGELAVMRLLDKFFIVRISWAFGKNGGNFVKTMLRLAKEKGSVSVVSDQFGAPTYTKDLSVLLADMIVSEKYGIYHAPNDGVCSWYEFALEIFKLSGLNIPVIPVTSEQYKSKAKRPKNSRLDKSKLRENGFDPLPDWKDALARFLSGMSDI